MLANASTFEEFKDIRDLAETARAYAKARGLGIANENVASEYVLRAERGMGKALIDMKATGARRGPGGDYITTSTPERSGATLSEIMGMPEKQANKYAALFQRLAQQWDDDTFDAYVSEAKAIGARLTKVDFYRGPKREAARDKAVIREAAKQDQQADVVTAFVAAANQLREGMSQLAEEDLRTVAHCISETVATYQAVRNARTA